MFGVPSKISSTICHTLHVLVTILPYITLFPLCTGLGYTMSVDHPQVSAGNPLKIPVGLVPAALDQIFPTGQAGSG